MIFFTSDHHFSHARIIVLDDRPFATIREHDEELIRLWNETVKPEDTVYHLGDFSFGPLARQQEMHDRLNGNIILIRGNHDGSVTRMNKVFKTVVKREMELAFHGRKVLLRHRPYHYPKSEDTSGNYDWLIHGHTHKMGQRVKGHMINVNVMFWDWRPVSEFEILSIMKAGEDPWYKKLIRRLMIWQEKEKPQPEVKRPHELRKNPPSSERSRASSKDSSKVKRKETSVKSSKPSRAESKDKDVV